MATQEEQAQDKVEKVVIPESDPTKPRFMLRIQTYLDNCERRIQEKILVGGEWPAGMIKFSGAGVLVYPGQENDPEPQTTVENFDIPGATTVEEAFALFGTHWAQTVSKSGAASGMPPVSEKLVIYRIDQYVDNNLQRVQEHVPINEPVPASFAKFTGSGIVRLPTGQELIEDFVLDGAKTLAEAFSLFPAVHREVCRRTGEQFRKHLLALKRQQDLNEIAGARAAQEGKKLVLPASVEKERRDKTGKNGVLGKKKKAD